MFIYFIYLFIFTINIKFSDVEISLWSTKNQVSLSSSPNMQLSQLNSLKRRQLWWQKCKSYSKFSKSFYFMQQSCHSSRQICNTASFNSANSHPEVCGSALGVDYCDLSSNKANYRNRYVPETSQYLPVYQPFHHGSGNLTQRTVSPEFRDWVSRNKIKVLLQYGYLWPQNTTTSKAHIWNKYSTFSLHPVKE
jgi:hypothetical protein